MKLLKKSLIAPSIAFVLSVNLLAQDSYTIETKTLKEALEIISEKSKLSYIAKESLLRDKKAPQIKNVEGLENALEELLKDSGLEAIIKNDTILIKKKELPSQSSTTLEAMTITATTAPSHYLKSKHNTGALGNRSILDTPFSITQVDSDEILHRGAKTIGQIFANDPSVYSPFASSTTTWWGNAIRGLMANNFYIDDVPVALTWGGDFPTEVVDKVSVLKGLGGFMYGFGAPGGIINYKLKRPSSEAETAFHLSYANNSRFKEHIDTSFNLGEDLGIRANIVNEHGTAYNESEADRQTLSLAIDKKFGDNLTWFNNIVYEKNKIEKQPFHFYFWDIDVVGGKLPKPTYDYENLNIDNSYYETETRIFTTGLDWQLDNQWKLNLSLGYSYKDQQSNRSFVSLDNDQGDYTGYVYNFAGDDKRTSANLMLQGDVSTSNIKHNVVLGLSRQTQKARSENNRYWSNDFNGNLYENQTYLITHKPDFSLASAKQKITQSSIFASDTITFNENWSAIAGLRFAKYKTEDLDLSDGDSNYDKNSLTPTLALIYKPNSETSLYASYVESIENGGQVATHFSNAGEMLDSTTSKQYEVGVKFSGDRLGASLALFRIERANLKVENNGAQPTLTQNGLVVYNGVELSTSYQLNSEFRLGSAITYSDASIKNANNSNTEGNVPTGVAKWQSVVTAEYQPKRIDGLSFHGNVNYSSDRYVSDNNLLEIPAYTTVNTGLAYSFVALDRDITLTANINNLFNKKYWAGGIESGLGEGRNFTFSLSTYF